MHVEVRHVKSGTTTMVQFDKATPRVDTKINLDLHNETDVMN